VTDIGASVPPPPRPVEYRDVDPRSWWIPMLAGLALVVFGLWLLTNLYESVTVLAVLVGVSLIVGGFVEAAALSEYDLGWVAWAAGAVLVVAGAVVLVWPDITLWVLAVAAGAALLVTGLLRAGWALSQRRIRPDWGLQLGIGLVGTVVGLIVLAWPDATLVVLAVLVGIRAVVHGLVAIGIGWHLRRLRA